jgi:glucose/arabinose dehydrogenase/cytochrome c551/c552/type 1 glutamine amidotransferase
MRYFARQTGISLFIFLLTSLVWISCSHKRQGKARVLVFSKTQGYHHESISDGIAAIQKLGAENNFDVDTTTNAAYFNEDTLKRYSAVVFLSTTGDLLNNYQEADFERYIQAGGGYVGVHAATDGEYDWGWYGRLVGGYFDGHPAQQDAVLNVKDSTFASTSHLPQAWKRKDEWYNFKKINPDIHILLTLDETSYQGGKHGEREHPMAWQHEYDGGQAFYTGLGHTHESFTEPLFLKHLAGGIAYAIGDNQELDYDKAKTLRVPDEDRFSKTALVTGEFFEPMEMTILPNLDILIAQRRGEILLYKNGDSTVRQVGFLNAYFKSKNGSNVEEGVLGIQADPNFEKNHQVFIFYSPADTSVNRLSRFTFKNDTLDLASEKMILQFYSQREICCHTGGSIAFDKDGLLFVSTGDNSNPFNEEGQKFGSRGYAPLDQRPGHEMYDARRTSGNAADLRGKILRIRVKEDGSYEIPDGNLYGKDQAGTRPEIYVQGNRNPFRISVDKKNGFVYWGEVGPDASVDSLDRRGPRGYDEVNQARKAGYFGWPLFVGNNYPYYEYNYDTDVSGSRFDPEKPVNTSRNNTGIKELPPAQPAFIWYPYAPSPDFPQVKAGGRNAMAGPVYYTDMFPAATRLPAYYDKKVFIFDWVRGWIKAVTVQDDGDFDKMEPFLEHTKLNSLIDLEVGPDGKLYMLEYGNGWFTKNKDAALSRIDFNAGNRPPKIAAFNVDKISGGLPFTLKLSVRATDPETRDLVYRWDLGKGVRKETSDPSLEYTFQSSGEYAVSVEVIDEQKVSVKASPVTVYAGNELPKVSIAITGNRSFYFPGKSVQYAVDVKDDQATAASDAGLFVSADYIEGRDKAEASLGHQVATELAVGKSLVETLDCKTCHKQNEKSIGPSYTQVSERYKETTDALARLSDKVIKGGSGVWGETNMPAHPDLKQADVGRIVSWILSLTQSTQKTLPAAGAVNATLDKPVSDHGTFILSATYTDTGVAGVRPLSGSASITLENNKVRAGLARELKEFGSNRENGVRVLTVPQATGSFRLDSLDLTGISSIALGISWKTPVKSSYQFEVHLDSPEGRTIGTGTLSTQSKDAGDRIISIKTESIADGKLHHVYIVSKYVSPPSPTKEEVVLRYLLFN